MTKDAVQSHSATTCDANGASQVFRDLAVETAVAVSINGTTHAVMMASPTDLRDFALGFAFTEGIITTLDQVQSLEILEHDTGLEARFWLSDDTARPFLSRRRAMAGPVGCGLCGIDSLEQAVRPLPVVTDTDMAIETKLIATATDQLRMHQPLHDQTHAAHAAGFLTKDGNVILAREDVGRHNALDKLIGAMIDRNLDPTNGAFVLTSRISVEMVQKTAFAGCPMIIAASAPTTHALMLARDANITLCASARAGRFDCYSHPFRLKGNS
jgi:FdhD protein